MTTVTYTLAPVCQRLKGTYQSPHSEAGEAAAADIRNVTISICSRRCCSYQNGGEKFFFHLWNEGFLR